MPASAVTRMHPRVASKAPPSRLACVDPKQLRVVLHLQILARISHRNALVAW